MSAIAYIEPDKITVRAKILLYGTYSSTELAGKVSDEINRMWNQPLVVIPVDGRYLKISFLIEVSTISLDDALGLIPKNTSYEVNFIRIEKENITERSMMGYGLGQNSGHWLITDNLGESTTAAHEFGHAMGLPHPDKIDYRGLGNPPIMAPRGTLVDAHLQWNPLADLGAFGGTMKPTHRRVWADEVIEIIARAVRVEDTFIIGELSNQIYDEIGRPMR